jgi:hypothetical protein
MCGIFADTHVDYEIHHGDEVFLPLADSNSQHYIYLVLRPYSPIASTIYQRVGLSHVYDLGVSVGRDLRDKRNHSCVILPFKGLSGL